MWGPLWKKYAGNSCHYLWISSGFLDFFFCVRAQTESSDEDEASGDEGLPDEDSDVSS